MRQAFSLLAAALLVPALLVAQEDEALVTDRPDFTESTATVARGRLQLEAGVTSTRVPGEADELAVGEVLLRIGTHDLVEVRLGLGSYTRREAGGDDEWGIEDPSLGVKLGLPMAAAARLPAGLELALLLGATLPLGEEPFREPHAQPEITIAGAWDLTPRLALGSNVGWAYRSDEGEQFGEALATLALGVGLGERLGAFLEAFALWPEEGSGAEFADLGLTWLVSPDLQLDVRAGWEIGGGEEFVGAGFARRW